MRIDSSGNVGIGTSSPSSFWSGGNQLVVGSGAGSQGLTIYSGTTSDAGIYFSDGTAGNALYQGQIFYRHTEDSMVFNTAAAEAMRITSSGALAVGDANPTRHGITTKTLIYNGSTTTSDFALHVGRLTTGSENVVCISNGYGKVGSITTSEQLHPTTHLQITD